MRVTIKNEDTGRKESGNIEMYDTPESLYSDLIEVGLIESTEVDFFSPDGTLITPDARITSYKISDDDTISIRAKNTKIIADSNPPKHVNDKVDKEPNISGTERRNIRKIEIPYSPQSFHQLGILVLDGSYSMTEPLTSGQSKSEAVGEAVNGLIERLKENRSMRNNFSFSMVVFGEKAERIFDPTPLKSLGDGRNFNPAAKDAERTFIHTGLEEATLIARSFLDGVPANDVPHSVVVLVLSDGECHEPNRTRNDAKKLNDMKGVKICSTFFGTQSKVDINAEKIMKDIVKNNQLDYSNTYDAESLRAFFERSLSINVS